jgi:hypothetical protein
LEPQLQEAGIDHLFVVGGECMGAGGEALGLITEVVLEESMHKLVRARGGNSDHAPILSVSKFKLRCC